MEGQITHKRISLLHVSSDLITTVQQVGRSKKTIVIMLDVAYDMKAGERSAVGYPARNASYRL